MTAPLPPPYLACELNGSEPVWTRDMVNRAVREALERLSQQAEPVDAHESTRMYHFAIKREQRLRELIGLVVEHVESPDHDGGISNALKQRLIDEMAAPPATQQQAGPVAFPGGPCMGSALQKLGGRLADMLDDDQWNNIEPMLMDVHADAAPPADQARQDRIMELADEMAERFADKQSMRMHYPIALDAYLEARRALAAEVRKL
jgi:hypothetical protein